MNKKYQVFISSTFKDMKDERQAAVEAILDAGHIPAGMELFAASDKGQIEVIKGWIDQSDIFMLMLGGRYGSVEPESGKSYIQLEYEHAVATGKPFFALYLTDKAIAEKAKGPLGLDATEQSDTKALNAFRALVKSKLCSEVEDIKDIRIHVPKAIRSLGETRKLGGWVRATEVPDLSPLLGELAALRQENRLLAAKVESAAVSAKNARYALSAPQQNFSESALDAKLSLRLKYTDYHANTVRNVERTWEGTYLRMFSLIAAKLLEEPSDSQVRTYIRHLLSVEMSVENAEMNEAELQSMKLKMVSFGVTELEKRGNTLTWTLTENGKSLMMKLHSNE